MALTKVSYSMIEGASVNVIDFGVTGNGTTDDSAALQSALNSVGLNGGLVIVPSSFIIYINSTINIPDYVSLVGGFIHPGVAPTDGNYYNLKSQILYGSAGLITLGKGSTIQKLLLIRAGLYTTVPTTPAAATTLVGNFAGVALSLTSSKDAEVRDCMILGHTTGITCTTSDRVFLNNLKIDCTNGVFMQQAFDICRIDNVHCWPFLTAMVAGVGNTPNDPVPLRRSGFGFKLQTNCDWSTLLDCFAYGYSRGFWLSSTSNIGLVRCQSDYTNPNTGSVAGIVIDGNSTYTSITACTSIAAINGVYADTTGGAIADSAIKIVGSIFANTAECIYVNNGSVICTSSSFHSGTVGVSFQTGADSSLINSNIFDGVGTPIYFANATTELDTTFVGNTYIGALANYPEQLANTNFKVWGVDPYLNIFDRKTITAGNGSKLKFSQLYNAGTQDSFILRSSLVSATATAERVNTDFGSNFNGSIVYRVSISSVGDWIPYTDNSINLGTASNRWKEVFAVNGTINTSDATQKQQIRPLSVVEKTVAMQLKAKICTFKMNDAVAAKGEDARIHVGVIAQDVAQVFVDNGLDAHKYGLFCEDIWYEKDGEVYQSSAPNIPEDAIEIKRLGVRYTELLAFIIASL